MDGQTNNVSYRADIRYSVIIKKDLINRKLFNARVASLLKYLIFVYNWIFKSSKNFH